MRGREISVGRRLVGLIVIEVVCGGSLLALLLWWVTATSQHIGIMDRYALEPIAGTTSALETAAQLKYVTEASPPDASARIQALTSKLEAFLDRYQSVWAIADNPDRVARRFGAELQQAGRGDAIVKERRAVASLRQLIGAVRAAPPAERDPYARQIRTTLRALLEANVNFMDHSRQALVRQTRRTRTLIVLVGVLAGALVTALGLRVHQAIAPRLRRLVDKVEKFREYGAFDREPLEGKDEIAILGRAIDSGFEAIKTREREREQFLAVAAHELKTPLTSILGFSQAALQRKDEVEMRTHALEVVRRHALRLGRLIDELLLASAARSGNLSFNPRPIDVSEVTWRVMNEVEASLRTPRFELRSRPAVRLLADETILGQGLWSLFTYAAAVSRPGAGERVRVEVIPGETFCRIEVSIAELSIAAADLERAFTPFAVVQFEGLGGVRSANGLFFCREIAHLHGGHLRLRQEGQHGVLTLELPK